MTTRRLFPVFLVMCAAPVFLAGTRRELPYNWDIDERLFVVPAMRMAATGNLDPYWFGHPGSTVIYPLAALFHLQCVLDHGCRPFQANSDVRTRFHADPGPFFEMGRRLSSVYGIGSLLLVWFIGLRAFSPVAAGLGTVWAMLPPVALYHTQTVRTDLAATFWGLLALFLLLRARESPTLPRQVAAGAVIGIAVATRYFMLALGGIQAVVAVNGIRSAEEPRTRRAAIGSAAAGLVAIPIAFLLVTPYFLPEIANVLSDLHGEARGLPFRRMFGNLEFYITNVGPRNLGWALTLLAAYGVTLSLVRGAAVQRLVALFPPLFLGVISLGGLCWARWAIPAIPVATLLAAHGLEDLFGRLKSAVPSMRGRATARLTWLGAVAVVSLLPVRLFAVMAMQHASRTTRVLAKDWVVGALPHGATLVTEVGAVPLIPRNWEVEQQAMTTGKDVLYEATLGEKTISVRLVPTFAKGGHPFEDYRRADKTYVVALADPEDVSRAPEFYASLRREGSLVARFEHSWFRVGPDLEAYRLTAPNASTSAQLSSVK